jgi:hypothetical protein
MITTQLITLADIRAIKSIALNIQQEKELTPYVLEAQNFDLAKFLGFEFYYDLIQDFATSPSLSDYSLLFNGGQYTHEGKTYYLNGVKNLTIYYAYRRYVNNSNVIATPTGFVHKTNQHSESVSEKTIARLVDNAQSSASFVEDNIKQYLDRKKADYPLWGGCKAMNNRTKIRQV